MYERIMVGIDDSPSSDKVLAAAIGLAKRCGAQLRLCHALDETPLAQNFARVALPDGVAPIEASLRATAMQFLEKAAVEARQAGLVVDVDVVESEREHAAELLDRAATDWVADLLVVGAHGPRGVARFFTGGIAEQLAGKAKTSLLIVRIE